MEPLLPTASTGCGYPDTYQMRSALNSGLVLWTAWAPGADDDDLHRVVKVYRGQEIIDGLDLQIERAPGSLLVEYRKR